MPYVLLGAAREKAEGLLKLAADEARKSTCLRRHCGSLIEHGNEILASAFNSIPGKPGLLKPHCNPYALSMHECKSDKTCCSHAEVRTINQALRAGHGAKFPWATLYFASVNEQGFCEEVDDLYCTICSKTALDNDVGHWVLNMRGKGPTRFSALEYHQLTLEHWQGKEIR